MLRKNLWVLAIASMAWLFTPGTSEAQWRDYRGGRDFERGFYRGNYPGSYNSWTWRSPGWDGRSYYPGTPGYYPGTTRYYYPGTRYYTYPRYDNAYTYTYPSTSSYQAFYPAESYSARAVDANTASFIVRVPDANAEVWFGDHRTQQRGAERYFTSGTMTAGQDYTFHVRARWMENGRQMDQTRDVNARAGQQVVVDFTRPDRERLPDAFEQDINE